MTSTWWRSASELDEVQSELIGLKPGQSVLITGLPGSGKTNLALLRALYLARKGYSDVVLLTMGRAISEFIYSGAAAHGLDAQHVKTFHSWGLGLLKQAGIKLAIKGLAYEKGTELVLNTLLDAARAGKLPKHDALMLDEAQDYPEGAPELFSIVADELFVTGDHRQRIFSQRTTVLDEFRQLTGKDVDLPFHYRNGKTICKVAGKILNFDYEKSSKYDEGTTPSNVSPIVKGSIEEQVRTAAQAVATQLETYPEELVGIMVPLNDDLDRVVDFLEQSAIADQCQYQQSQQGFTRLNKDRRVLVTSMHSAKGMEFRAGHILAADGLGRHPRENQRNLAFTAVTRAKTSLTVYREQPAPAWLESAVNAAGGVELNVSVEDLFRI